MSTRCNRFAALVALATALLLGTACEGDATAEPPSAATTVDLERPAPSATPRPVEEGPLVLFLGDSLSAGLHLPADDAFPAVLQRRLAADGLSFRLLNAGISGDTTAGGLARVDWLLRQEPDLVVVELGANDGLRGLPLDSIESNLDAILERVLDSGARALLLGMRMPPNYGQDYTEGYAALFERVAERHDVPLVPFFLDGVAAVPEMLLPDQLHPNVDGHVRAARNLIPSMTELLRELDASVSSEATLR